MAQHPELADRKILILRTNSRWRWTWKACSMSRVAISWALSPPSPPPWPRFFPKDVDGKANALDPQKQRDPKRGHEECCTYDERVCRGAGVEGYHGDGPNDARHDRRGDLV